METQARGSRTGSSYPRTGVRYARKAVQGARTPRRAGANTPSGCATPPRGRREHRQGGANTPRVGANTPSGCRFRGEGSRFHPHRTDKPADARRDPAEVRCGSGHAHRVFRRMSAGSRAALRDFGPVPQILGHFPERFVRARRDSGHAHHKPAQVRHGSVEVRRVSVEVSRVPHRCSRHFGSCHLAHDVLQDGQCRAPNPSPASMRFMCS